MRDEFERIMKLQPLWSHKKTIEMDERGILVRHVGPSWLRDFAPELAATIGIPLDDLLIEGRDGTGPKTEVPWFRFGSKSRSPSATTDWYCVYLFDTAGAFTYLSLAHGSTDWTGVDFRPRPTHELRALAKWGRDSVERLIADRRDLSFDIALMSRRSDLGPAYEAGTAVCVRYARDSVPSDGVLKSDALFFAGLLGEVYRASDKEPMPVGPGPEVTELVEAVQQAAGKRRLRTGGGQGFRLTGRQRVAVENHAMELARVHLLSLGWSVTDTSATKPYDFLCTSGQSEVFVEVKGTTSGGQSIVLTRGEVDHHRAVWPNNALIIVSGIELYGEDRAQAAGGVLTMVHPWEISDARLTVVSYIYAAWA